MIECVDRGWKPAGRKHGIAKKYVIGPAHWRYEAFQKFAQGVEVDLLPRRAKEKSEALVATAEALVMKLVTDKPQPAVAAVA